MEKQYGVVAIKGKREAKKIVLITKSSSKGWIVPKGNDIDHLSRPKVAAREAFEEAGLIGKVKTKYWVEVRMDKKQVLRLYLMHVKKVLSHWPEKQKRKRRITTIVKAMSTVRNVKLGKAIKRLCHGN